MINLNDFATEQKEVKIFNGGTAGKVDNVGVQVIKKTSEDKENSPDYKINYIDESGATVNDGIYYPKDGDTDRQKQITLSRLLSILHALSPETRTKVLPEFQDYKSAVDFLIKQIIGASKSSKVNVFVCYGTKNNPNQYLRLRKFEFVEAVGTEAASSRLKPKATGSEWDDVMERITPTTFDSNDSDDDMFASDDKQEGIDDW